MSLFSKPKYSTIRVGSTQPLDTSVKEPNQDSKKLKIPPGTFDKCKGCEQIVHKDEWKKNNDVCPHCDYHRLISAYKRIELLTDLNSFEEIDSSLISVDILKFEGVASYTDKLEQNKIKTGLKDAVICGSAKIMKQPVAIAVMDFRFLGASMGSVVGEKITRITEYATKEKLPLIIVTASGGARMYEGLFSLMQMAKTSGALERHKEANLPYIVVMTHPTTAGVTASFASLGDIIIAEPKAMIAFAGPRVIRDTTQATLPEGFQSAEFLLNKGLIDRVIHRKDLKNELALLVDYLTYGLDYVKKV